MCLFPSCLEQQLDPPQKERLGAALTEMDQQLRKLADTPWLCQPMEPGDEEVCGSQGFSLGIPACSASSFSTVITVICVALRLRWRLILQPLWWLPQDFSVKMPQGYGKRLAGRKELGLSIEHSP